MIYKLKWSDIGKCRTCQHYSAGNMKLVDGKFMDGYCNEMKMDIPKQGNSGCSEYNFRKSMYGSSLVIKNEGVTK